MTEKVEIEVDGNKRDVFLGFRRRRRFLTKPLHRFIDTEVGRAAATSRSASFVGRCLSSSTVVLSTRCITTWRRPCDVCGWWNGALLHIIYRVKTCIQRHPTSPFSLCTPLPPVDQEMGPRSAPSAGGGQRVGGPLPPSGSGGLCGERAGRSGEGDLGGEGSWGGERARGRVSTILLLGR